MQQRASSTGPPLLSMDAFRFDEGGTTKPPGSARGVDRFDPDEITPSEVRQPLPLQDNMCRNPDARSAGVSVKGGSVHVWCFTSNPLMRWDYCNPLEITATPPVCTIQVVLGIMLSKKT